jgi:hypothetical protein
LENYIQTRAWRRANRVHDYLVERQDRLCQQCLQCGIKKARISQTRYACDTPWDRDSRELHFCSDDCGDSYMYEEPWAYFWCNHCDREICEQNPWNGWHIQYRSYDDEQICLRCLLSPGKDGPATLMRMDPAGSCVIWGTGRFFHR